MAPYIEVWGCRSLKKALVINNLHSFSSQIFIYLYRGTAVTRYVGLLVDKQRTFYTGEVVALCQLHTLPHLLPLEFAR